MHIYIQYIYIYVLHLRTYTYIYIHYYIPGTCRTHVLLNPTNWRWSNPFAFFDLKCWCFLLDCGRYVHSSVWFPTNTTNHWQKPADLKKTWHAIRSLRLFRFKTHPNQTDQTSAVNPWGSPWFTHASSTVASVLSTFLYDVSLQVLTRIDHRDIQLFQQTWKVLGNGSDDPWGTNVGDMFIWVFGQ